MLPENFCAGRSLIEVKETLDRKRAELGEAKMVWPTIQDPRRRLIVGRKVGELETTVARLQRAISEHVAGDPRELAVHLRLLRRNSREAFARQIADSGLAVVEGG